MQLLQNVTLGQFFDIRGLQFLVNVQTSPFLGLLQDASSARGVYHALFDLGAGWASVNEHYDTTQRTMAKGQDCSMTMGAMPVLGIAA